MTRHQRGTRFNPASVLLALISFAAPCHAGALYSITDLGPAAFDQTPVFTTAGRVGSVSSGGAIRPQDGPYSIQSHPTEVWPIPYTGPYDSYLSAAGQPTVTLNTRFGLYESVLASAVNLSGMAVGTDVVSPGYAQNFGVPFVYSQAAGMQAIPLPYQNYALTGYDRMTGYASSINDAGLIVGTGYNVPGNLQNPMIGFLSDGQHSWDLNTLIAPGSGWFLSSAIDIDDAGRIVGLAYRSGDGPGSGATPHVYLLTPLPAATPEPASWLVMATGGLAIVLGRAAEGARMRSRQAGPFAK